MSSWVVTISKDYPQHWDYARQHGVWDMPKRFPIRAGDRVYFRLAGGPLLGQTLATSDPQPLTTTDEVPWDDGREPYTTRFTFQLLSDQPRRTEPWGRTAARLTKNPVMQVPRSWDSPRDEAVLASYFEEVALTPEQSMDDAKRAQVLADLGEDLSSHAPAHRPASGAARIPKGPPRVVQRHVRRDGDVHRIRSRGGPHLAIQRSAHEPSKQRAHPPRGHSHTLRSLSPDCAATWARQGLPRPEGLRIHGV